MKLWLKISQLLPVIEYHFLCNLYCRMQFDWDFSVERHLALNHSFNVFIVSHAGLPPVVRYTNHTRTLQATIVPNDPADFSRNSFDQKTINTLFQEMNFGHIDLLRLANLAENVNMWELVHYMTADNLFLDVHQLHLAVYIGENLKSVFGKNSFLLVSAEAYEFIRA